MRRHLGDEDGVGGGGEGLALVRQHGVHGVAHLVRHGEGVRQGVGVVEQHVGVDAVDAGRKGAGPLALVFVDVDPALGEGAADGLLVGVAEDGHRLDQLLADGIVGQRPVDLDERQIGVEVAVAFDAQGPPAEPVIALQRRAAVTRGGDEVLDHGGRNVVVVELVFESGGVAARPRGEPVFLKHAVVDRRKGVR